MVKNKEYKMDVPQDGGPSDLTATRFLEKKKLPSNFRQDNFI